MLSYLVNPLLFSKGKHKSVSTTAVALKIILTCCNLRVALCFYQESFYKKLPFLHC